MRNKNKASFFFFRYLIQIENDFINDVNRTITVNHLWVNIKKRIQLNFKILPEDAFFLKIFRYYNGKNYLRLKANQYMVGESLKMFMFSKKMGATIHDLTNKRHSRRRFSK